MTKFKAKCPGCRNTTFEPAATGGREPRDDDVLTCTKCGRKVRYRELTAQVERYGEKIVGERLGKILGGLKRK